MIDVKMSGAVPSPTKPSAPGNSPKPPSNSAHTCISIASMNQRRYVVSVETKNEIRPMDIVWVLKYPERKESIDVARAYRETMAKPSVNRGESYNVLVV